MDGCICIVTKIGDELKVEVIYIYIYAILVGEVSRNYGNQVIFF